jgi:hypothetical protein
MAWLSNFQQQQPKKRVVYLRKMYTISPDYLIMILCCTVADHHERSKKLGS